MSSHKRSCNATKKEVHWESLLGNMSSLKRSYNATNKQAHSQHLFTYKSSVKRSYYTSNIQNCWQDLSRICFLLKKVAM